MKLELKNSVLSCQLCVLSWLWGKGSYSSLCIACSPTPTTRFKFVTNEFVAAMFRLTLCQGIFDEELLQHPPLLCRPSQGSSVGMADACQCRATSVGVHSRAIGSRQ